MIHRFAEIVAVADLYEMLTLGRRHYCDPHSAQDAIRKVIELSGSKLHSEVVKNLVSMIPLFPTGARIRIVNSPVPQLVGYTGVVAKNDPDSLDQPSLVLYETKNHQRITPILVDTAKHSGIRFELVT